jgi:ketosteroid isomerase-like protein
MGLAIRFCLVSILCVIVEGCAAPARVPSVNEDRRALEQTSTAIVEAFANGDIQKIMAYHHPDVAKALSFHNYLIGREAVRADLEHTFASFRLEFIEHQVESLTIEGDTAIEQTVFTIRGTPRKGGEPFSFRGRAMVVYVRYTGSPSGWASVRELIQPATD